MPVDTARCNASDFAEDMVKQSDKQCVPKRRVLNFQFAQSTVPCVPFESYGLFLSALATGLWTR